MFSFHKPKIYRSLQGCCICRAKSSSSRFTDSKRYESDFDKCFQIDEVRQGEICNACVLLVKRWKKLPSGSTRNWHHVVDARAGPGTKSITKIKNRVKEQQKEDKKLKKHKHRYQRKTTHAQSAPNSGASSPARPRSPGAFSDDIHMSHDYLSDRSNSDASDHEDNGGMTRARRHRLLRSSNSRRFKRRFIPRQEVSAFLDLRYWKRTQICCGIVFKGRLGELLLDANLYHPCKACKAPCTFLRPPRKHSECSMESGDSDVGALANSQDSQDGFPTPPDTQPSTPTYLTAPSVSPEGVFASVLDLSKKSEALTISGCADALHADLPLAGLEPKHLPPV